MSVAVVSGVLADPRVDAGLRHENVGTVEQRTAWIARRYHLGRCPRGVRLDGIHVARAGGLFGPDGLDGELEVAW